MANNESHPVAAVDAVATSISSNEHGYTPPQQSNWKACWSGLFCFRSQRREKRVVPAASRLEGPSVSSREWQSNGLAQGVLALAPPSSPVSFLNSSVQSPANFSLALSAASANMCSPPLNPMFMIGPYAHETQLVSPPVFSTFTTEPSTAPFTPPPELAHLTTPSSPDVPFAELLASSLEAKASAMDTVSPFSGSSIASPCDFPSSDLQFAYQLYPGSPVGHLVSSSTGIFSSGTSSPVPIVEMPGRRPSRGSYVSSFPKFGPFTSLPNDQPPCAKLFLPRSLKPESQTSLLLSGDEVDGPRFSLSCCSDLRSESDIKGETDPKVVAINTDNCSIASTGLYQNKIV